MKSFNMTGGENVIRISVVVVTRNRAELLKECLESISGQTVPPDQLVIVDNDSEDETAAIVREIADSVIFPVSYVLEKRRGFPVIRNRGLRLASHKWVAFIDDDCIAERHWLEAFRNAALLHPDCAALSGACENRCPESTFALIAWFFEQYWKTNGYRGSRIMDFEILDTKNIMYNKNFLDMYNLSFDEQRKDFLGGSAEDCDFGMQMQAIDGAEALYCEESRIKHKYPSSLVEFYAKNLKSMLAFLQYRQKWAKKRRVIDRRRARYRLPFYFYNFVKLYRPGPLPTATLALCIFINEITFAFLRLLVKAKLISLTP